MANNSSNSTMPGKEYLRSMLNKPMKIKLCDGRELIGVFLCTDKDLNVILGSCIEYTKDQNLNENLDEKTYNNFLSSNASDGILSNKSRAIGSAMIPGKYILSVHIDDGFNPLLHRKE